MTSIYANSYYKARYPDLSPSEIKTKIESRRQVGLENLVRSEYMSGGPREQSIDGRALAPTQRGALAFTAATTAGVIVAVSTQLNPAPAGPPTAGAGLTPNGAPTERLLIRDQRGQIAARAVAEAFGRQDGKKADVTSGGLAFKSKDLPTLGRQGDSEFGRGPRLDNRARAGQDPDYNEGGRIDGRGPASILGYRAPAIPARMALPQPKL